MLTAIDAVTIMRRACLRSALPSVARVLSGSLCLAALACGTKSTATQASHEGPSAAARANEEEPIGYFSGSWWEDGSINNLLLSASQIVISYAGADAAAGPVPFELPARSKDEALRLARSLRGQLRSDPNKFAELAMKYSDEPVSAALGGSLGNFLAVAMPRGIVDALGNTQVGEVSRIVETPQGYHLLRRQAVRPASKLAFSHIVIKHVQAAGWRRADRSLAVHTRAEARALAQQAAALAAATPDDFAALVQRYSEAEDALRGGDVGLWAGHEHIESEFLLFEIAERLPIGGVSGVIETGSGFHVVKRSPEYERARLAMSAITLLHSESQFQKVDARATRTKAEAQHSARMLLAELKLHPERFSKRQAERCELAYCAGIYAFDEGRGPPSAEAVLRRLKPGQLYSEPLETPFGFVVLRREDPARAASELRVELSTDFGKGQAKVAAGEADKTPAQLADDVREFERYALRKMRLSDAERSGMHAILEELAVAFVAQNNADMLANAQRADQRLAQLLGSSKHEELTRHRTAFFAEAAE